jgi:hypothetical protein
MMPLPNYSQYPYEKLSLTTGTGEKERVPYISGLNWGQRPGRNPDQAYLSVPSHIQKSGFFPKKGEIFQIVTVDGEIWDCARRQANGKAIQSVNDNSIIGRYFRKLLNLESGDMVSIDHLLKYGRTSIDIYKKSKYVYILDFMIYDKLS